MNLIIGGGITGLSFLFFDKTKERLLIEKDATLGGYCRTIKRNGFVWDYSGHFFHFQDKDIKKLLLSKLNHQELLKINKRTRIKYEDLYIDYPFQKNIHQLEKKDFIDCLYDLFNAEKADYRTFKEMLFCKFGKSISEKFLIPYNEKLYACDLNTLDRDAMGRFFPYADKDDIIKNFKEQNNSSYNNSFIYPKGGAFEYVNALLKMIDTEQISLNTKVVAIDIHKHEVTLSNGEILIYDNLISTLPFPVLLDLLNINYDHEIYRWNQVLVFNLGFNCKGWNTQDHWLYFPEKKYCFYRVGFYDNILKQQNMSLYVELGFEQTYTINEKEWLGKVLSDLKKAGVVSEKQILIDYEAIIMNPAYVHIKQSVINDIQEKKELLSKHHIYSIGRYGSWTYCSIEDNIKEAHALAERI